MEIIKVVNRRMPPPLFKEVVRYKNGDTFDIINTILYADAKSSEQTKPIALAFRGRTMDETCKNLWTFVNKNIKYTPDRRGHEKVQAPAMLWHTKKGDCKSFSIFIGSVLKNLGIPYYYRFVKYSEDRDYTHVYIVAGRNKNYIIDAVHTQFNNELAFKDRKDYGPMTKISYLHGPKASEPVKKELPRQPQYNWYAMSDGEFRLALVQEQLELLQAATGDPTGEYEEAKTLISQIGFDLHKLHKDIPVTRNSQILGITQGHINRARKKPQNKTGLSRIGTNGKFLDEGPWPMPAENMEPRDLVGSWKVSKDPWWGRNYNGPMWWKGEEYPNWDYLFMNADFDCHYDMATSNGMFAMLSRRFRNDMRLKCEGMKVILQQFNDRYESAAPQMLYQFAGSIPGRTSIVDAKMLTHKIAVERFARAGSIDLENMILWTRNGILRQWAETGYDVLQPESLIQGFRDGSLLDGNRIGEPATATAIVTTILSILASAVAVVKAIRELLSEKNQEIGRQFNDISTDAASAKPSDWTGVSAQESALPIGLLALGGFFLLQ
jgi:hypothetical protein